MDKDFMFFKRDNSEGRVPVNWLSSVEHQLRERHNERRVSSDYINCIVKSNINKVFLLSKRYLSFIKLPISLGTVPVIELYSNLRIQSRTRSNPLDKHRPWCDVMHSINEINRNNLPKVKRPTFVRRPTSVGIFPDKRFVPINEPTLKLIFEDVRSRIRYD